MTDRSDIEKLIVQHSRYIERICMRACYGEDAVCAELVQETYLALLRNRESLRPGSNERQVKAWVKWQCRSVISHWRHNRKTHRWVPLSEVSEEEQSIPDHSALHEMVDELAEALLPRERELLAMFRRGCTPDEMAAALGVTKNNLGVMYSRMVSRMRKRYEQIIKKEQS